MSQMISSEAIRPLVAGQAVYTWSSQTVDGVSGDDFVALSPGMRGKLPWLKNLPASIIQFASGSVLTSDQRSGYKPVGRHIDGSEAVLFRKVDAGKDAHGRPGRYIVHLIVGQREYLPLSSLYTIYRRSWLSADDVPLNQHLNLQDLQLSSPSPYEIAGLTQVGEERVIRSVKQLVSSGAADVTGLDEKEMLAILACLPTWVDANAVLTSVWVESGPKVTLTVPDGAPPVKSPDYRARVHVQEIEALRAQYSDLLKIGGSTPGGRIAEKAKVSSQHKKRKDRRTRRNGGMLARKKRPIVRASEDAVAEVPVLAIDDLRSAVEKWQHRGSRKLSVNEKQIIERAPADALSIISQSDSSLPDKLTRGQLDALAVKVLRECGDVRHWEVVVRCLPEPIEVIRRYVNSVAEPSVLLAAFSINLSKERRFEIVLDRSLSKNAIASIIGTVRESKDLTDGLCESLRISCYQHNRLLGTLLLGDESDQEWLFAEVLPRALDQADIVPIAADYPEQLIRWLKLTHNGYARGFIEMLQWYTKHHNRYQRRMWEPDLPRATWRKH